MSPRGRGLVLPYRSPFCWPAMIDFLSARATPGVERILPAGYRRTIRLGADIAVLDVSWSASDPHLAVRVERLAPPRTVSKVSPVGTAPDEIAVGGRVRRMFDLDADPQAIDAHLRQDDVLARRLTEVAGVRVPGAWDGYELAVRAILGQQVSVSAATTLAGRIASAHGQTVRGGDGLTRLFPTPDALADAPLELCGVMPARARAIRTLSQTVASGGLDLGVLAPADARRVLTALPGIGPWTAAYIAMRALGDPDACPSGDLVLRQAFGRCTASELEARAERWRPWRAYAVMLVWHTARDHGPGVTAGRRSPGPGTGRSPSRR